MVTDDDVAVQDSLYTAGRRGVGVTVLVEKIAGAAAEEGRSLAEVADVARKVNAARPQHGHGADLVHRAGRRQADVRPARGRDGGRHRHPRRARPAPGAAGAGAPRSPQLLVEPILDDLDFTGGDGVLAFVNGMGGTPLIELYLMYHEVDAAPGEGRASRSRARWSATTSPAWTWPAARSPCSRLDDELLRLWDAPVQHARPCGGASDGRRARRGDDGDRRGSGAVLAGARSPRRSRTTATCSPSSTPRSATPTTAPT